MNISAFFTKPRHAPWTKYKRAYESLDQLYRETVVHLGELDTECIRLRQQCTHSIGERAQLQARLDDAVIELGKRKNLELKLARCQEANADLASRLSAASATTHVVRPLGKPRTKGTKAPSVTP